MTIEIKIRFLLGVETIGLLTDWQRSFLSDIIDAEVPLTERQAILVDRIYGQYAGHPAPTATDV